MVLQMIQFSFQVNFCQCLNYQLLFQILALRIQKENSVTLQKYITVLLIFKD